MVQPVLRRRERRSRYCRRCGSGGCQGPGGTLLRPYPRRAAADAADRVDTRTRGYPPPGHAGPGAPGTALQGMDNAPLRHPGVEPARSRGRHPERGQDLPAVQAPGLRRADRLGRERLRLPDGDSRHLWRHRNGAARAHARGTRCGHRGRNRSLSGRGAQRRGTAPHGHQPPRRFHKGYRAGRRLRRQERPVGAQ